MVATWSTPTRYEADEEVPWGAALVLLDIETGAVEAWLEGSDPGPGSYAPLTVSASHRFLIWPGRLYDRESDRWYAWDQSRIRLDRTWGVGSSERLLFHIMNSGDDVMVDAALQSVMRIAIPPGERFASPTGGYILVRECVECEPGDRFHLVNLEDETSPTTHTWTLPWQTIRGHDSGTVHYDIQLLDELVAIVRAADSGTCRVARYNLSGALLSDVELACQHPWRIEQGGAYSPRISPDGSMIVAEARWIPGSSDVILSIFSVTTGGEALRVKSMWPGRHGAALNGVWSAIHLEDLWLADSSGIVVITPRGPRIVTLDGAWEWAPGRPSMVDAELFYSVFDSPPAVMNRTGEALASVSLGPHGSLGLHGLCSTGTRADWGLAADTVRIRRVGGCAPEGPAIEVGALGIPLAPVIERPPFDDRLLVEVVVDTCLNLREEPSLDAPIVECLPDGTVAETDAFRGEWMHLRTDDGLEGWASAEYLRWYSDGVRLEE